MKKTSKKVAAKQPASKNLANTSPKKEEQAGAPTEEQVEQGEGDFGPLDDDDDDGDDDEEDDETPEEKKPLVLTAKNFNMNIYAEDTQEYDEGAVNEAEVVLVKNPQETFAYFVKLGDQDRANRYSVGKNHMYTYQEALELARRILN